MEAVDFRIEVGDRLDGGYRLTVRSEDDEFQGVAELDLGSDSLLQTKLSYLRIVLQSSSAPTRATSSVEEQDVQFIGGRLFRQLLVDESMGMLARARRVAHESGRTLRVTLRIRPPELAALPWEFMYDARTDRSEYLARQCLVVRDAKGALPVPPLRVTGPLRMLAMVADVADLPRLDTAAERERLERALGGLTAAGRIEIRWADATKSALLGALRQGPWHVFHYIGHGEYDAASESGRLVFTGPDGGTDFLGSAQLSAALATHPTLRLAVLNACETGVGGPDPHSSVATALTHGGLPAVVGMQYPITDLVAPMFSQAFYEALAEGAAVDRCVQAGRMAIWLGNPRSLEWGTPVLYQRSADGRVFEVVEGGAAVAGPAAVTVAEVVEVPAAVEVVPEAVEVPAAVEVVPEAVEVPAAVEVVPEVLAGPAAVEVVPETVDVVVAPAAAQVPEIPEDFDADAMSPVEAPRPHGPTLFELMPWLRPANTGHPSTADLPAAPEPVAAAITEPFIAPTATAIVTPVVAPVRGSGPRLTRVVHTESSLIDMAFMPDQRHLALLCAGPRIRFSALAESESEHTFDFTAPGGTDPRSGLPRYVPSSLSFDPTMNRMHVVHQELKVADPAFIDVRWRNTKGWDWKKDGETPGVRVVVYDPLRGGEPLTVTGDRVCRVEKNGIHYGLKRRKNPHDVRHAAVGAGHVAAVTGEGKVLIWRRATGDLVREVPGSVGPVALSVDGRCVLHMDQRPTAVRVTDIATGSEISRWNVSDAASWSYSRGDTFFWRYAQTGHVNRLATRKNIAEFPAPYRGAGRKPPVFSKSGRYLAVPTSSSTVEIWDLTPGAPTPASADPAPAPGA